MKKILVSLLASMMILMSMVPAFADPFDYTDQAGTKTKLEKYLVYDGDADTPNVTFTYGVTGLMSDIAGTAGTGDTAGTLPVKKGIDPNKVRVVDLNTTGTGTGDLVFSPADAGTQVTASAPGAAVCSDTTKKYVKKDIGLSFEDITFPEPGVYRYFVEETRKEGETTPPVDLDTKVTGTNNRWRTIDVYVEDTNGLNRGTPETAHGLVITGFVSYEGKLTTGAPVSAGTQKDTSPARTDGTIANGGTANGNEVAGATKNNKYVNEYETHDLEVEKIVKGNQGSRDQFFEFTIVIANAGNGTVMKLDTTNCTIPSNWEDVDEVPNAATTQTKEVIFDNNMLDEDANKTGQQVIAGTDGSKTIKVYLQHGQKVVLQGLPRGATYTVTETTYTDYKTRNKANDEDWTAVQDRDYTGTSGDYVKDENGNFYKKTGSNPAEYITVADYNALDPADQAAYDTTQKYTQEVALDFENAKSGIIPTGLIMGISGGLAIVALAIVMLTMLAANRRKEEEEA